MKLRNGFISNSSSSSFILSPKDVDEFSKRFPTIALYSVSALISTIKPVMDSIDECFKSLPCFIKEDCVYYRLQDYFDKLKSLQERLPGAHITEEIDRDWAFDQGIDYPLFEGDL